MSRDWQKDMELAIRSCPPSRRLIPVYNDVGPGEYLEEILIYWLQEVKSLREVNQQKQIEILRLQCELRRIKAVLDDNDIVKSMNTGPINFDLEETE